MKKGIRFTVSLLAAAAIILPLRSVVLAGYGENQIQAKVTGEAVELKWENDGRVHDVMMANEEHGPYNVIGQSRDGRFTFNGSARTGMWFAQRVQGETSASLKPVNVVVMRNELEAPGNASARRLENGVLRLSWKAVSGTQEYEVLMLGSDGMTTQIGMTKSTHYDIREDKGLDYGVRAWSGVVKSNISVIPGTAIPAVAAAETTLTGKQSLGDRLRLPTALSTPTPAPTATPIPAAGDRTSIVGFDARALESSVFREINARRTKLGLPEIAYNAKLQEAARYRARELADNGYFEHRSKGYNKLEDCAEAYTGRRPWWVAECLMWGSNWRDYNNAVTIVDLWRNSAAHWEALTTREVSEGGVGIAISDKAELYVVAFPVQWER